MTVAPAREAAAGGGARGRLCWPMGLNCLKQVAARVAAPGRGLGRVKRPKSAERAIGSRAGA
jgi:hypothetical protein